MHFKNWLETFNTQETLDDYTWYHGRTVDSELFSYDFVWFSFNLVRFCCVRFSYDFVGCSYDFVRFYFNFERFCQKNLF